MIKKHKGVYLIPGHGKQTKIVEELSIRKELKKNGISFRGCVRFVYEPEIYVNPSSGDVERREV
jgi:hypothetical protein